MFRKFVAPLLLGLAQSCAFYAAFVTSANAAENRPDAVSRQVQPVAGMPQVADANNLYSETRSSNLSPTVAKHLARIYVPNRRSNDVTVIDPATFKVVDHFPVGVNPQHVVPSWDLKTLWVNNNAEHRTDGSVTPIDPLTGKPGKSIAVSRFALSVRRSA